MKTINEEWTEFKQAVIPNDAPTVQLNEMQLAFYAGFYAMLRNLNDIEQAPDEDINTQFNGWIAEVQALADEVRHDA